MIIFDYNQVAIANLMEQIGSSREPVDESLIRHMILNTIRSNITKFSGEYGKNIVIACDGRKYWRKEIFPLYKSNRKKNRSSSGHDWNSIFEALGNIRDELREYSPYKVIHIDRAEADDVIGVLTKNAAPSEKVLILSSDKDFVQLHSNTNVKQWSPSMKKWIKSDKPELQLHELIITGDKDDGIPNILSGDNFIAEGIRQKPITKKFLSEFNIMTTSGDIERNWHRNKMLIDLNYIPEDLKSDIINTYETIHPANKQKFMNYMIAKRLKNLLEVIHEF